MYLPSMACCDAQIVQNPAFLARRLAKIEKPAPEPWAAEAAIVLNLASMRLQYIVYIASLCDIVGGALAGCCRCPVA